MYEVDNLKKAARIGGFFSYKKNFLFMQIEKLTADNWVQVVRQVVDMQPTIIYKRLSVLYPGQLAKYMPGYEKNDSSKLSMKDLIVRKATASGDPVKYIQNVL